jgi:ribonuclease HI
LSKPPREWLKINSDGAYSASSGAGGWGFVTRDHEGDVVVAGAGALKHVRDALHAEAFACLQGAMAAADKGIGNTILEISAGPEAMQQRRRPGAKGRGGPTTSRRLEYPHVLVR